MARRIARLERDSAQNARAIDELREALQIQFKRSAQLQAELDAFRKERPR